MAVAKRKSVSDASAPDHQRLNVRLSPDAYRRLGVHALMAGMTPGKLVERLINEHLREWRVQQNPAAYIDRPASVADSSSVSLAVTV